MPDEHTATSSKGQALNVTVLGKPAWSRIRDLRRDQRTIAHGPPADFHRGGHVALNKRRRNSQGIRDIVKPFGGIIRRKKCRDIHVKREQIADHVGVFGPIEPMQRRSSRIGAESRVTVDARFEFGGKGIQRRPLRPASTAGRHHARSDFAYDLLPDRRIFPNMLEVHCVEGESGGFCPLVVAGNAVLIEEGRLRRDRGIVLGSGDLCVTGNDSQEGCRHSRNAD